MWNAQASCTTDVSERREVVRRQWPERRRQRASRAASIYLSANKHTDTSGEASTFDHRRHKSKVGCCQTPEFQRGRGGPRAHLHSQKFVARGGGGGRGLLPSALAIARSWMIPVNLTTVEAQTSLRQHEMENFLLFFWSGSIQFHRSSRGFPTLPLRGGKVKM